MRRPLVLLLALAGVLALGACGNRESEVLRAETEGIYVDVGDLQYQVQISRLLNPFDREDRGFLIDLPAGQTLEAGQQWFAVFMRVNNAGTTPRRAAESYSIHDTQDDVYRPITMGDRNVFAYRGGVVGAEAVLPEPSTPAAESTIQGSMLLFKVPTKSLENRPLELRIEASSAPGVTGIVDLDV